MLLAAEGLGPRLGADWRCASGVSATSSSAASNSTNAACRVLWAGPGRPWRSGTTVLDWIEAKEWRGLISWRHQGRRAVAPVKPAAKPEL